MRMPFFSAGETKTETVRHSAELVFVWLPFRSTLCEPGRDPCYIQPPWKSAGTAWHCRGAAAANPPATAATSASAAGATITAPDGRAAGPSGEGLVGRGQLKKPARRKGVLCSIAIHQASRA